MVACPVSLKTLTDTFKEKNERKWQWKNLSEKEEVGLFHDVGRK